MDHRKNFVTAIRAVADMDHLLAQMDKIFLEYHQTVIKKIKGEIDSDQFKDKVKELAHKRKQVFTQYDIITKKINRIKDEYGGEVRG